MGHCNLYNELFQWKWLDLTISLQKDNNSLSIPIKIIVFLRIYKIITIIFICSLVFNSLQFAGFKYTLITLNQRPTILFLGNIF